MFADDTSLYIIVDLPEQAAMVLNADLQTISHWANDWLVLFNANKTLSMVIPRKLNPVQHPPLFMNDTIIAETTSHKHLGLTFSSTCTWNEHVNNISLKAWTRVNLLSRKSLEKLYISFIRPLLEYSDSVWDNCSSESKKQLEAIHTESARIVSGATKLCSIEKLFVELGWESLQSRQNKHKLILFYKIFHGLTPDYLYDLVPPLVQDTTSYNLRNSDNIQNYRARSNLFLNSFFPSTIRAWNDLPNDTKNASSVASFKHRLNRNLKPPPKYYNVGSRKGQILQARLRLECSSLNSDLYRKHIVPSPSCRVVSLKVLLISSSTAQSIQTKGKHVYQTTSGPSQLKTSYLDVKMLQSKTINHSFCKFKILLLILEDFPNSAQHNYTFVMVPNGRSSVTS